ncbi:hypothetical protein V1503_12040 [Bacillus sp. SCS-151]|uniref:hypothetical protein n=1 Tax=Nanhaiella sioensis TaxID=3115293 RepID=UPI00397D4E10
MKNKIMVGILTASLAIGAGTTALANGGQSSNFMINDNKMNNMGWNENNFEWTEMKEYMEEVHPDLGEEDLQEMYNSCHGESSKSLTNTTL